MPRINFVMTDGDGGSARLNAGQRESQAAPYGYVEIGSDDLDDLGSFPFRVDQGGNVQAGGSPILQLQASTGVNGFALQNATPTILTWTAPDDGQMHRVMLITDGYVTSAQTGGAVSLNTTLPNGQAANPNVYGGGSGTGPIANSALTRIVGAGTTVSLVQSSAQTAGAAKVWAELWAA